MFKKVLKIIAVICTLFASAIILLPYINKSNVNTQIKGSNEMQVNYTAAVTNTWNISANADESVIATLDENGLLTISGEGSMKDWEFNSTSEWHSIKTQIKQLKIEEGVTNIGNHAFFGCTQLSEIEIPNSITNIGESAFEDCRSLTEIVIPGGVATIEREAFCGCNNITSITIEDGVTTIGNAVFAQNHFITEVIIPESVTSMESSVFNGCDKLTNIKVNTNNANYCDINGVLYTIDKTVIIKYPEGKTEESYTICSEVTSIDGWAFFECKYLQEIIIPDGVIDIGELTFYNCTKLTQINIPSKVTSIGEWSFRGCNGLTRIIVPKSLVNIGKSAFFDCKNLTILCYEGSTIHNYAQENEIPYEIIYLTSDEQTIDQETLIIRGIEPKTTVQEIKTCIQSNVPYEIINKSGEVLEDTEIIGTGYTLKMCTGETYKIIVWGDLNGDGEIKISELARASRIGISEEQISETEMLVMDVSMDGNIKINDLAAISRLARK